MVLFLSFLFFISEQGGGKKKVTCAEMKLSHLSSFFEEKTLLEFYVNFQQEKRQGLGWNLMPRLGSVEIRNSLEGKTRARSPLGGSRQHYHGSSYLTHRMVRTWLSGVIFQHVQWTTALVHRWQRRAGLRDYTPILPFIIDQRESIFKGKLAKGLEIHFIFISYTIFSFILCIRLLFFFNHLIGAHTEMIWLKSRVREKTYNSLFGCKRLCSL